MESVLKDTFAGREIEQGLKPNSMKCAAYRPG
jgi:hypothetical protein